MAFHERGTARLFYETWGEGSGDWVTLINGYSRSSTDFRALARYLSERGMRVLTFDNRGAGQTECPLEFTRGDLVADVISLWDRVGADRSHLLGISYGGVIGLCAALEAPARARSLTLISTAPSSRFIDPGTQLSARSPKEVDAAMSKYFSTEFAQRNQILFRALLRETAKAFTGAARDRAKAQRQAMGTFELSGELQRLRMPALIVHGDADRVIDVAAVEAFRRGLVGARIEIFAGAGHLLLAEAPKKLYELIGNFYRSLSTARSTS